MEAHAAANHNQARTGSAQRGKRLSDRRRATGSVEACSGSWNPLQAPTLNPQHEDTNRMGKHLLPLAGLGQEKDQAASTSVTASRLGAV